jgi:cell division protein FtsQ
MTDRQDFAQRQRPRTIVRRSRPTVGERRTVAPAPARGVEPPRERVDLTQALEFRMPRRWVIAASAIAFVFVLIGAGLFTLRSDLFAIQEITVQGNVRVSMDDIVQRSGLLNESMFTADLGGAQQAVAGLSVLKSVRIERSWPHSVTIAVEERQAWGTWEQSGVLYTIDSDGVVLGSVAPPGGSPVIESSEPGSRHEGDHVDYQAVAAAAEIYNELPAALGVEVAQVAFLAGKGVQVTTTDGQTALFGDSSSIAYKLAVWSATQKQAKAQGIAYTTIDLRFGNRPVLQ